MSQDNEIAPGAPPPPMPWLSTQHEMESRARAERTRFVRIRMKNGTHRIACASYQYSSTGNPAESTREHLYRVSLQWLAELDGRDGKAIRIVERPSLNRPTNALQFRVLESAAPDGTRSAFARLGPRGQIGAEPRGAGVMSFLRAILVEWVVEQHPDAVIIRGSLNQPDPQDDDDTKLRDAFFTRAGFTVQATSDGGGTYSAPTIRALKSTWNTEKVVELTAPMIADAFGAQLEAGILRKRADALQAQLTAMTREKRASDFLSRIWLAVSVVCLVLGLVFGIQPRLA
jgi:hypothetical protein